MLDLVVFGNPEVFISNRHLKKTEMGGGGVEVRKWQCPLVLRAP